jgi:hypothetical protein
MSVTMRKLEKQIISKSTSTVVCTVIVLGVVLIIAGECVVGIFSGIKCGLFAATWLGAGTDIEYLVDHGCFASVEIAAATAKKCSDIGGVCGTPESTDVGIVVDGVYSDDGYEPDEHIEDANRRATSPERWIALVHTACAAREPLAAAAIYDMFSLATTSVVAATAKDPGGSTELHRCAESGCVACCKSLIKCGAFAYVEDASGKTSAEIINDASTKRVFASMRLW